MTTLISTLFPLGGMRERSRLWCRAVVFAGGAAVAGELAEAQVVPFLCDRPAHPAAPNLRAVPAGEGSPAATWAVPEPQTPHEAKLTASDGVPFDRFGFSVALSAERALVGAREDDDRGTNAGSAYVFERQADGTWAEVAKLTASDGGSNDFFGFSVALSAERALVGACADDDLATDSGAAYIFERQADGTWAEVAKLTASDGIFEYFGYSVALSGERALVGAWQDGPGAAYIFERQADGTWAEVAKLTASDGKALDTFGSSVALFGERALVGAEVFVSGNPGAAYIFERQADGTWAEVAKLTASDEASLDRFGASVALSSEGALVGAYRNDDLGFESGSAYVFELQADGTWAEVAKLIASDGTNLDYFGVSVALFAERALVGAYGDDDLGFDSGSAYVFELQADGTWAEVAKLTASDGGSNDSFGFSVALSAERALVGAWGDTTGAAYVYSLEGCELALGLDPLMPRAGEELRVAVDLHHRRPVTVTVPFLLWIEDAAGQVVVQKSSSPITMEPGDHRKLRLAITLPLDLPAGKYRVLVGVDKMQQGIAGAARRFRVVE